MQYIMCKKRTSTILIESLESRHPRRGNNQLAFVPTPRNRTYSSKISYSNSLLSKAYSGKVNGPQLPVPIP